VEEGTGGMTKRSRARAMGKWVGSEKAKKAGRVGDGEGAGMRR
jgi:hypothetical protein